ncbi:MAG: GNAT family N-acetyltransferase, partial [Candidatus Omnitrophica bacterium]|nr:GNAT family N-acetyltransferase [Candidatus Omnitrophota bacterium]
RRAEQYWDATNFLAHAAPDVIEQIKKGGLEYSFLRNHQAYLGQAEVDLEWLLAQPLTPAQRPKADNLSRPVRGYQILIADRFQQLRAEGKNSPSEARKQAAGPKASSVERVAASQIQSESTRIAALYPLSADVVRSETRSLKPSAEGAAAQKHRVADTWETILKNFGGRPFEMTDLLALKTGIEGRAVQEHLRVLYEFGLLTRERQAHKISRPYLFQVSPAFYRLTEENEREFRFVLSEYTEERSDFGFVQAQIRLILNEDMLFALPENPPDYDALAAAMPDIKHPNPLITFRLLRKHFGTRWVRTGSFARIVKGLYPDDENRRREIQRYVTRLYDLNLVEMRRAYVSGSLWVRINPRIDESQIGRIEELLGKLDRTNRNRLISQQIGEIVADRVPELLEAEPADLETLFPEQSLPRAGDFSFTFPDFLRALREEEEALGGSKDGSVIALPDKVRARLNAGHNAMQRFAERVDLRRFLLGASLLIRTEEDAKDFVLVIHEAMDRLRKGNNGHYALMPLRRLDLAAELGMDIETLRKLAKQWPVINACLEEGAAFSFRDHRQDALRRAATRRWLESMGIPTPSAATLDFAMGKKVARGAILPKHKALIAGIQTRWRRTLPARRMLQRKRYIETVVREAIDDYGNLLRSDSTDIGAMNAARIHLQMMVPGHPYLILESGPEKRRRGWLRAVVPENSVSLRKTLPEFSHVRMIPEQYLRDFVMRMTLASTDNSVDYFLDYADQLVTALEYLAVSGMDPKYVQEKARECYQSYHQIAMTFDGETPPFQSLKARFQALIKGKWEIPAGAGAISKNTNRITLVVAYPSAAERLPVETEENQRDWLLSHVALVSQRFRPCEFDFYYTDNEQDLFLLLLHLWNQGISPDRIILPLGRGYVHRYHLISVRSTRYLRTILGHKLVEKFENLDSVDWEALLQAKANAHAETQAPVASQQEAGSGPPASSVERVADSQKQAQETLDLPRRQAGANRYSPSADSARSESRRVKFRTGVDSLKEKVLGQQRCRTLEALQANLDVIDATTGISVTGIGYFEHFREGRPLRFDQLKWLPVDELGWDQSVKAVIRKLDSLEGSHQNIYYFDVFDWPAGTGMKHSSDDLFGNMLVILPVRYQESGADWEPSRSYEWGVTVRPLEDQDVSKVVRLSRWYIDQRRKGRDAKKLRREIRDPDKRSFIAEKDGRILGLVSLSFDHEYRRLLIERLAVDPKRRRAVMGVPHKQSLPNVLDVIQFLLAEAKVMTSRKYPRLVAYIPEDSGYENMFQLFDFKARLVPDYYPDAAGYELTFQSLARSEARRTATAVRMPGTFQSERAEARRTATAVRMPGTFQSERAELRVPKRLGRVLRLWQMIDEHFHNREFAVRDLQALPGAGEFGDGEVLRNLMKSMESLGVLMKRREKANGKRKGRPFVFRVGERAKRLDEMGRRDLEFVLSSCTTRADFDQVHSQVARILSGEHLFRLPSHPALVNYPRRASALQKAHPYLYITLHELRKLFGREWINVSAYHARTRGLNRDALLLHVNQFDSWGLLDRGEVDGAGQGVWIRFIADEKLLDRVEDAVLQGSDQGEEYQLTHTVRQILNGKSTLENRLRPPSVEEPFKVIYRVTDSKVRVTLPGVYHAIRELEETDPPVRIHKLERPLGVDKHNVKRFDDLQPGILSRLGVASLNLSLHSADDVARFDAEIEAALARLRRPVPGMPVLNTDLADELGLHPDHLTRVAKQHKIDLASKGVITVGSPNDGAEDFARQYLRSIGVLEARDNIDFVLYRPGARQKSVSQLNGKKTILDYEKAWRAVLPEWRVWYRIQLIEGLIRDAENNFVEASKTGGTREAKVRLEKMAPGHPYLLLETARAVRERRPLSATLEDLSRRKTEDVELSEDSGLPVRSSQAVLPYRDLLKTGVNRIRDLILKADRLGEIDAELELEVQKVRQSLGRLPESRLPESKQEAARHRILAQLDRLRVSSWPELVRLKRNIHVMLQELYRDIDSLHFPERFYRGKVGTGSKPLPVTIVTVYPDELSRPSYDEEELLRKRLLAQVDLSQTGNRPVEFRFHYVSAAENGMMLLEFLYDCWQSGIMIDRLIISPAAMARLKRFHQARTGAMFRDRLLGNFEDVVQGTHAVTGLSGLLRGKSAPDAVPPTVRSETRDYAVYNFLEKTIGDAEDAEGVFHRAVATFTRYDADGEGVGPSVGTFFGSWFPMLEGGMEAIRVGPDDHLLELGAGTARASIFAAARRGARATAYELDPKFYEISRRTVAAVRDAKNPPPACRLDRVREINLQRGDFMNVLKDKAAMSAFTVIQYFGIGSGRQAEIDVYLKDTMRRDAIVFV